MVMILKGATAAAAVVDAAMLPIELRDHLKDFCLVGYKPHLTPAFI
jgi:hypothetical protein